jgi:hypothetical protein
MLDGKTGKPRTIIDIEKAALLTAEEGTWRPSVPWLQTCGGSPYTTESDGEGDQLPPGGKKACFTASFRLASSTTFVSRESGS